MIAQPNLFFESFVRTGAQIVVNHIAWTNIWAACLILLPWPYPGCRTLAIVVVAAARHIHSLDLVTLILVASAISQFLIIPFVFKSHGWQMILFHAANIVVLLGALFSLAFFVAVLLLGVPTLLFYFGCWCNNTGAFGRMWRGAAGLSGTLLLFLLYFALEPHALMFVVAAEQVIVNIFLQYAASNKTSHPLEDAQLA